jgi:hypothetical protein
MRSYIERYPALAGHPYVTYFIVINLKSW